MLIVLANEPRVYREAIAAAIRRSRPVDEIVVVNPEALDAEVQRLSPDVIICSRPPPAEGRLGWMTLYPRLSDRAVVSIGQQAMELEAPDLQLLLAFLTMVAAQAGGDTDRPSAGL